MRAIACNWLNKAFCLPFCCIYCTNIDFLTTPVSVIIIFACSQIARFVIVVLRYFANRWGPVSWSLTSLHRYGLCETFMEYVDDYSSVNIYQAAEVNIYCSLFEKIKIKVIDSLEFLGVYLFELHGKLLYVQWFVKFSVKARMVDIPN